MAPGPRQKYDNSSIIDKAVQEVQNGGSYRKVAAKYGIPKSTLEFKKKNPGHKISFGPSPILTDEEENTLVQWIIALAKKGFPRKKDDILTSVQKFLISNPRVNPFKNNKPGDGWFKAFMKRHPEISERTSEAVTTASSCVSEQDIRKWFAETEEYLVEKDLLNVITDSSRVFNGDETGFQICPATGKVFAQKGTKNVYSIDRGSSKENITVMFTFSANGEIICPMIIYPYKRIPEKISASVNPSWGIGRSDNGWMTSDTFYQYIANVFYPHLVEKEIEFPVILFVDGHKSHLTYELSILCNTLKIEVIALYPNATRIIQPADVAVFRPVKVAWRKAVREWQENHPGEVLNKVSFAPLLQSVVETSIKPETLVGGFRVCGLCPFNVDAIDYSKCLGKSYAKDGGVQEDVCDVLLNYDDFKKIVGEESIKKFKQINEILPTAADDDAFLKLYKIWKHFSSKEINVIQDVVVKPANELPVQNLSSSHMGQESTPSTILFDSEENAVNIIQDVVLKPANELPVQPLPLSPMNQESTPSTFDSGENTDDLLHNIESRINNNQDISDRFNRVEAPSELHNNHLSFKQPMDDNSKSQSIILKKTLLSEALLEKSNPSINLVRSPLLGDFLSWPDTPKRQGKRNTERFPFAITSHKYQAMFEKKRELQLEEQKKKDDRRRKREQTKQNRETKPKKRKTKTYKEVCNMCKTIVASSYLLQCDECKSVFHKKCVPSTHKQHIPDKDDDDMYLCHKCYKEESEDDCNEKEEDDYDEEKGEDDTEKENEECKNNEQFEKGERSNNKSSSEVEENIEEEENIDESQYSEADSMEIDMLYEMYKKEMGKKD